METIDQLATLWAIAKQKEDAARDERVGIEKQILALHPAREEGSETFATPAGAKITLTGKVSYKANVDTLLTLTAAWPADVRPIKVKTEADEAKLRAIRAESPKLWAQIAAAVETKPAKTGVAIKWSE